MSECFWCLLVDIQTCEKDLAKLVLVSVEDQRDTPSPLSADSPSPSPVFLTSPQHHSSSSSACSLSSSGSDIVRPKDFYLPFSFWWHHQVLLRSSQFPPDHMAVLCRLQLHRILHSFCPPPPGVGVSPQQCCPPPSPHPGLRSLGDSDGCWPQGCTSNRLYPQLTSGLFLFNLQKSLVHLRPKWSWRCEEGLFA